MYGVNRVFLVGYLGSDPQMSKSKNGKEYAKLNLATHRSSRMEDGEWRTTTDWHNVTVWGKRAETCSQHLKKGAKIMVEGFISNFERKNDDGETFRQTAITANNVEFFASKVN